MSLTFTPAPAKKTLSTSVGVGFGSPDTLPDGSLPGEDQNVWILEASNRPPIIPGPNAIGPVASYFRVHPSALDLRFEITSGSINENASKLRKHVYEVVSFNGSQPWVSLRYPKPANVKFMIYGKLVSSIPPYTNVITLSYDSARNILKASSPCYGMVKVEYYAPYDLWLATFGYSSVPAPVVIDPMNPGDPDDEEPLAGLDPMFIMGKYRLPPTGYDPDTILCSLTLQPPTNNKQDEQLDPTRWAIMNGTDSRMPNIKLEIDAKDPVALKPGTSGKPSAGCTILITPAVVPAFNLTSGIIISSQAGGSLVVEELMTFNGSGSSQLRYQPAGSVSFEPQGNFVNRNGKPLSGVQFARPGQEVIVVDWDAQGRPTNMRPRTVNVDEIVLLDGTGYTVQGYGILKVSYSITQWRMEYRFEYNEDLKNFLPAWMVAIYNDQTATLQLSPPSLKPVK